MIHIATDLINFFCSQLTFNDVFFWADSIGIPATDEEIADPARSN